MINKPVSFRRYLLALGIVGVFGASISGCGTGSGTPSTGGGNTGGGDNSNRSVCVANSPRSNRTARWTVLIYMNAANNLQPDSLTNVAQMASVGSDANVNIVLQWKQASCADCGAPSFFATRRYLIKKHTAAEVAQINSGDTSSLDADRLPDPTTNNTNSQSDMGDWQVLHNFAAWGAQTYPADHLAVLLWDHGAGWRPTRAANKLKPTTRAFSQDNETNNEIETEQTPQALANLSQPIDLIAFDCSLMMMVEVAYELRNSARVLVGSEESPPGAGYPYDAFLNDLKAGGKNPCDVGTSIVQRFVAAYPQNSNITQSMIDLTKMESVASSLDAFSSALRLRVVPDQAIIRNARNNVQSYAYPDNKDLINYSQLIAANTSDASLKQAAANLQTSLNGTNGAIMLNMHGSFSQSGSNGMAVYVPAPIDYLSVYGSSLALSRVTHWPQFLQEQR